MKATGGDPVAVATAIAYPVGDSLLLALALVLVLCGGVRLRFDSGLITIALLTFGVADSLYIYQAATGAYVAGGPIDLSWLVAFSVIALASCVRETEAPVGTAPDEGWLTTLVPTGCAFGAVGVEIYGHFKTVETDPAAARLGRDRPLTPPSRLQLRGAPASVEDKSQGSRLRPADRAE